MYNSKEFSVQRQAYEMNVYTHIKYVEKWMVFYVDTKTNQKNILFAGIHIYVSYIATIVYIYKLCHIIISYIFICSYYFIGLPYIRLIPKVTAVSGETLHLKCPVAGYPIEEIHWERGTQIYEIT